MVFGQRTTTVKVGSLDNVGIEVLVGTGFVATITAMQLFTNTNPLGRCYTFWKQLGAHVSTKSFVCLDSSLQVSSLRHWKWTMAALILS